MSVRRDVPQGYHDAMKNRPFGKTGFSASEIGLGCWQLGGNDWGDVPEEKALAILSAAADSGVNFFDTADVYGGGRSESLVGKFLQQRKTRKGSSPIFVATKLGRSSDPGWPQNFTLPVMRRHTEASLKRLGVESIDLTQLHCIPLEALAEGSVFDALETLRGEGKIRAWAQVSSQWKRPSSACGTPG